MPQMTVFWDRKKYPQDLLLKVLERAPFYSALALSTQGNEHGMLTSVDFMIKVEQPGKYDRGWPELGILIEANHFDERAENLEDRSNLIARGLETEGLAPEGLDLNSSFVWIRLSPAGYTELGRKQT